MEHTLSPTPRPRLRAVILAVLLMATFISSGAWLGKLFGAMLLVLLAGTYRYSYVHDDRFQFRYFVGFVPMKVRSYPLKKAVRIEVDQESPAGVWTLIFLGPWNWLWCHILDHVFPWFGGRYRLWLCTVSGKRVLAWQGNSDACFQQNLRFLETVTGLPIERSSGY